MPIFFNTDYLQVRISFRGRTAGLVAELSDALSLEPSRGASGIQIIVYSIEDPSDEVGSILQGGAEDCTWRSYNIRNRIEITERSDRNLFLCGINRYPSDYPTTQLKRQLIWYIVNSVFALLSDRLLLIHGALIVKGKSVHVMTGPSGAGKSTIASRVPPPWIAPADDLIAAVKIKDKYALHPLPTWSQLVFNPELYRRTNVNESYPLGAIHFLEQSLGDGSDPITQSDAAERLLRNSYSVYRVMFADLSSEDRLRCKLEILRHASAITRQASVDILKVSLDGKFWELLSPG
jgi:SynChlorMet cassette protein ScmC